MVNVRTVLPSLFSLALASSHLNKRDMRLHERRDSVPEGFTSKGPAPGDAALRFRLALVQNDTEGLQTKLMDISTPSDPQYGQWLSKEEVGAFVTPKRETVTAVKEWLAANGLNATVLSPFGDWIGFETTVSNANLLFDADFSTFVHDGSGKGAIRTLAYSIPASLSDHLQLVHPTISFPAPLANDVEGRPVVHSPAKNMPRSNIASEVTPTLCDAVMTPECIQQLYKIPRASASQLSNKLAVSGFLQEFANRADLRKFLEIYRTDVSPNNTFTLQTIDGGTNSQIPDQTGIEADLDVQYTIGLASGVRTVFISVGDQYQDGDLEGFLDIINFLSGKSAPPQVLTTSYGQGENTISRALAYRLCNAYASLSARGVTILFSSGDGGVSGSQNTECTTFVPTFPSGCPFVTSVGGTQNFKPETSAPFSSGGFSNYFDTPSYQVAAKEAYLTKLGSTYAGRFNTSGRGFPDVSAAGTNLQIVSNGYVMSVVGTSCSSPVFASVVSLLNDRLIAAGKPVLGFLNPFLYSTGASALNDITTGGNPGCDTNGFPATTGWDPVTGLGTPNWAKLLAAAGL
ncbi:subtilisin-like protein [Lactarius hatsudake]|nr:subtilisin-like protein [Lactarius hatsudake]